jgi:tetratricopeptide (TPR) repeat protein
MNHHDAITTRLLVELARAPREKRPVCLLRLSEKLNAQGAFAQARSLLEEARDIAPQNPRVLRALGLSLCRAGELRDGLAIYDRGRWRLKEFEVIRRPLPQPIWAGEPVAGKSMILSAEQGIGDQVMQLRVVPELLSDGTKVAIELDPRLFPLVARSFPEVRCAAHTVEPDAWLRDAGFEFRASMLSAWRWTSASDGETIQRAYLKPDAELVRRFRSLWQKNGCRFQVGLSWRSAAKVTGKAKSIDPEMFAPLFQHDDVAFHALQYDTDADEVAALSAQLGRPIGFDADGDARDNIDRLAAQIAALDLVISIDNTTVHVAGAMGTMCFAMLPCQSDWRWGTEGRQTALYSSLRLYRNRQIGRWGSVMAEVARDFEDWAVRLRWAASRSRGPRILGLENGYRR